MEEGYGIMPGRGKRETAAGEVPRLRARDFLLPFPSLTLRLRSGQAGWATYDAPRARKQRRRSQGRREGTMYCAPTSANLKSERRGVVLQKERV